MLGKLIKHEWKATWKFPTVISLFVVLMTILGVLSFKMPFWSKVLSDNFDKFTFFDVTAIGILVMYFIYIVVAVYAVMIYFSVRFYKNMYTDEGYLVHTLPVKPSAHIFSKTFVSGTWYLGSTLLLFGSMSWLFNVFTRTLLSAAGVTGEDLTTLASDLDVSLTHITAIFNSISSIPFWLFVVVMVLMMLIGCYSSMLLIYVCISIGQLFQKHKILFSILAYLALTTVMSTVMSVASIPAMFSMMLNENYYLLMESTDPIVSIVAPYALMAPMFLVMTIIIIIFTFVGYFVTERIMRRKLNLD